MFSGLSHWVKEKSRMIHTGHRENSLKGNSEENHWFNAGHNDPLHPQAAAKPEAWYNPMRLIGVQAMVRHLMTYA
jgi:hypothetical protein